MCVDLSGYTYEDTWEYVLEVDIAEMSTEQRSTETSNGECPHVGEIHLFMTMTINNSETTTQSKEHGYSVC